MRTSRRFSLTKLSLSMSILSAIVFLSLHLYSILVKGLLFNTRLSFTVIACFFARSFSEKATFLRRASLLLLDYRAYSRLSCGHSE